MLKTLMRCTPLSVLTDERDALVADRERGVVRAEPDHEQAHLRGVLLLVLCREALQGRLANSTQSARPAEVAVRHPTPVRRPG